MREIMAGRRGLAGVMLTFVIAWALIAVVLLTGVVTSARQINRDVGILINPRLNAIHGNTRHIALAERTFALSKRIRSAAVPLTGELAGTLTAAQHIDTTASSILTRVQTINGTVSSIHGKVLGIGTTVDAIGGNVAAIGGDVQSIYRSVASIGADSGSILASVRSIGSDVGSVNGDAGGILSTARLIVPQVRGINARAVTIQRIVTGGIGPDLARVLALVGAGNAGGTIDGSANGIDCSALLNLTGHTTGCGR